MDHFYIRHVLGGQLFFDSKLHNKTFTIEPEDGCWIFTINELEEDSAQAMLEQRDKLNLFVVPPGDSGQKSWYYTSKGDLSYNKATQQLTIRADHRMDYSI